MYVAIPPLSVTAAVDAVQVAPCTARLVTRPVAENRLREPSPTALPAASVAVTVKVTSSPGCGAVGLIVNATVLAVIAPTLIAKVFVIVEVAIVAAFPAVIVAVPDLTPRTVTTHDATVTVATEVSDENA